MRDAQREDTQGLPHRSEFRNQGAGQHTTQSVAFDHPRSSPAQGHHRTEAYRIDSMRDTRVG